MFIKIYRYLLNIIKLILKKTFVKNVLTVVSGTVSAQIITFLFTPFITRLYGPEAFGILGIFITLIAITNPIAALTYPMAIVLPKNDSEAKELVRLSMCIGSILTLFVILIIIFSGQSITQILQVEELNSYLLCIPLTMIFWVGFNVTEQWLIRKQRFNVLARANPIQAFISNLLKLGVGTISPSASILIVIQTFGYLLYTIMVLYLEQIPIMLSKGFYKIKFTVQRFKQLLLLAKKYYEFPLYRTPQVLLNEISQNVPIVMLAILFGPVSAGFYTIGNRVLQVPAQIIGNSVGNVFYPRASSAAHNGESITMLQLKATLSLVVVGIIPFGIIILFGPWLFQFIFGVEWNVAGQYARWLAISSFFAFINIPSIKTLPVISAQKFFLFFTIINTIIKVAAILIGGHIFNSDIIAIALFAILGSVFNVILIVITIFKSKKFDKKNNFYYQKI